MAAAGPLAGRLPDTAGHRPHAADDRPAGAAQAVGEATAEGVADHEHAVAVDAVGRADRLDDGVEERVVPEAVSPVPGLVPAVYSVRRDERGRVHDTVGLFACASSPR